MDALFENRSAAGAKLATNLGSYRDQPDVLLPRGGVPVAYEVARSLHAPVGCFYEPVEDPLDTIRKIAEARQFSQKLTDEVVSSYLVEPEPNRFGVINAFTNAAQKLGPIQRIGDGALCGDVVGGSFAVVLSLFNSGKQPLAFFFPHET